MHVRPPESWKAFLSCIVAVALTACSAARPQYTWHDLGQHQGQEVIKVSPPSQKWGKDADGPEVMDPQIAPGNLLSVRSSDDTKLNGEVRVEFDGTMQMPYDMTVNTSGLTLAQLEKKLNEMYRPYFKSATGVKLRVQERKCYLDLRGLVEKPGRYLVEQNASLDQVMATAGGLSKESLPRFLRIQKGSKVMLLDLPQYLSRAEERPQIAAWLGGETLSFQKDAAGSTASAQYRMPVHVMGEVRKPGEYPIRSGSDFVDLVTQADGFTESADLKHIELIRRTGGKRQAYEFQWRDFHRAPAPMDGDVIYVHADRSTRTERQVSIAASILAALATMVTAVVLVQELD